MIWEETRWESKVKEKWGKSSADEAIAGNIQDYLIQDDLKRNARDRHDPLDHRLDDRAA